MSRMAFERDPAAQIKATLLDYNDLTVFSGQIRFKEGSREVDFSGRRISSAEEQPKKEEEEPQSCIGSLLSKMQTQFDTFDPAAGAHESFKIA